MSWVCPWCGFENYQMPLNSRHEIFCKGCGKNHTTPEEVESMIKPQIEAEEAALKEARAQMNEARDHIASLNDEMATWQNKYEVAAENVAEAKKEIKALKNVRIHREADRVAKTRLDIHQKTLPFEVPA